MGFHHIIRATPRPRSVLAWTPTLVEDSSDNWRAAKTVAWISQYWIENFRDNVEREVVELLRVY